MYKVVGFYDDIYPMQLGEFETLEEAKERQKEAYEQFDIVRIFHKGEEIKCQQKN